jgi:hypothetical protein
VPLRWAACSLFESIDIIKKKLVAYKSLRKYKFAACVKLPDQSGYLIEDNGHIDFWMFDSFDPVAAIVHVKEL